MKTILKKHPQLQGFFDFNEFNPIQVHCIPKIMQREDNLIVSAPTSSGKTVLFELAILKYSHLPSPTCLYLAPIKSLCHEKYRHWNVKFRSRMSVLEVTGDTLENGQEQHLLSHIVIGTPEKVDFLSRQSLEYLKKIRLLLIDEVHMLNFEERGATLQAIVSRIMSLNNKIRIIAVSATIPNINEVGQWLKVPKHNICVFGEEYRPVKINKIVLGFKPTGNPFTFQRSLNFKLLEAIRHYSEQRGSLIFCPTQKGTESACQQIITMMKQRQFIQNDKQLTALVQAAKTISNSTLQIMIPQGIAFHNASLSSHDRNTVQRLFHDLKIKILCTTSTLAMGINLPARLVIVKSTQSYKGSMKGYQQYTRIEMDQMMGRAGRPPFDTQGTVVIMTQKNNYHKYNSKLDLENLQSQLFTQMLEHLNAEISLGSINSLEDVFQYIRNSFCYIRMKKSPSIYGITGDVQAYIQNSCRKAIQNLAELGIITFNIQSNRIFPRPLSNSISRSAVQIKSIAYITKISKEIVTQKDYLFALCCCQEIGRYSSKLQERKTLKAINQSNKYTLKQAISTSERKSFVLVQAELSKKHIEFWELRRQASDVITLLKRLNYCIKVLGTELKNFWIYYWASKMQKYFSQKYWESAQSQRLLQFTGLEDKYKFLNLRGIKTIEQLQKNLSNIGSWLQKGQNFVRIIEQQLSVYSQTYYISVQQQRNKQCFTVKLTPQSQFIGKLKGMNLCVGDSKNNLYFHKYYGGPAQEIIVTFPKNGTGAYKIGVIKDGIIGFDEFYIFQKGTIVKSVIDVRDKRASNTVNRKSIQVIKKEKELTTNKQRKSKSHEIQNKINNSITTNPKRKPRQISIQSHKNPSPQQQYTHSPYNQITLTNKRSKQLKLPPNYHIKHPLETEIADEDYDSNFNKKIKKEEKFSYKPLNQYKWKPGFEEINSSSSSELEQKPIRQKKPLKLVQSKQKFNIFNNKNITNITIPRMNDLLPTFPKFPSSNNINLNTIQQAQRQQSNQQPIDVFSYFYNLF